jgi:hypothetical protein
LTDCFGLFLTPSLLSTALAHSSLVHNSLGLILPLLWLTFLLPWLTLRALLALTALAYSITAFAFAQSLGFAYSAWSCFSPLTLTASLTAFAFAQSLGFAYSAWPCFSPLTLTASLLRRVVLPPCFACRTNATALLLPTRSGGFFSAAYLVM